MRMFGLSSALLKKKSKRKKGTRNNPSVSSGLKKLAVMDTDAHTEDITWQLKNHLTTRKVEQTDRKIQTIFVKPSQGDPGLWEARCFVRSDVRHFNFSASVIRPQSTCDFRSRTFRISLFLHVNVIVVFCVDPHSLLSSYLIIIMLLIILLLLPLLLLIIIRLQ